MGGGGNESYSGTSGSSTRVSGRGEGGYVRSHFSGCSCHADITVGGIHTSSLVGRPAIRVCSGAACRKDAGVSGNMWPL